jgi:hypothetical protein
VGLRSIVKSNGTAGQYTTTTATTELITGVIGFWDGTSSTSTPNAVIVTGGPKWVGVGAAGTIGTQTIQGSATAGLAAIAAPNTTTAYQNIGIAITNYSGSATSCAANTICSGSAFTNISTR